MSYSCNHAWILFSLSVLLLFTKLMHKVDRRQIMVKLRKVLYRWYSRFAIMEKIMRAFIEQRVLHTQEVIIQRIYFIGTANVLL